MYKKIAQSFNKAASKYDKHAVLQRHIGSLLVNKLKCLKIKPNRVLDLGCGTGYMMQEIEKIWPDAEIINIDLAFLMCHKVKQNAICMLAQNLALQDNCFDLVVSNLMLQWLTNELEQVFHEVNRVLKPNGVFLFSTLGPDTLQELQTSWSKIDAGTHVNAQLDMHIVGDFLNKANLQNIVMDRLLIQLDYNNIKELFFDLKGVGASLIISDNKKTNLTKSQLQTLECYYKQDYSSIIATYEAVFGLAYAPIKQHNEVLLSEVGRKN